MGCIFQGRHGWITHSIFKPVLELPSGLFFFFFFWCLSPEVSIVWGPFYGAGSGAGGSGMGLWGEVTLGCGFNARGGLQNTSQGVHSVSCLDGQMSHLQGPARS